MECRHCARKQTEKLLEVIFGELFCSSHKLQPVESFQREFDFGYRVRTGPGNPGKSWNFIIAFSRTGKSWKSNAGPGKSWKSVKLNKVIKFSLKQMSKVFLVFL